MSRAKVVLLPGFNGRADQPILVKLSKKLEALDFDCHRIAPPRLKLTPDLDEYVAWLDDSLSPWGRGSGRGQTNPLILIGRSFGGRLAIRLAARRPLAAVVLLGFPIRPKHKPRPLDEAALSALTCPCFIAQGTKDELGPLGVLRQFSGNAELLELEGAGHSFGRKEKQALDAVAAWLDRTA